MCVEIFSHDPRHGDNLMDAMSWVFFEQSMMTEHLNTLDHGYFFFTSGTGSVFAVMFASPLKLVSKMLLLIFWLSQMGTAIFSRSLSKVGLALFCISRILRLSLYHPIEIFARRLFISSYNSTY